MNREKQIRPPALWHCACAAAAMLACFAFSGCKSPGASAPKRYQFSQPQMGTMFNIALYAGSSQQASNAAAAAFAKVAELNRVMTDYDPESELMQLRNHPPDTPVKVSPQLFDVLQRAHSVAVFTDGAFDITVGEMVQLWRRARRQNELPDPEHIARARAAFGWWNMHLNPEAQTVSLHQPDMRLDLGGIAKGYAADAALRVLKELGFPQALVAASGDIVVGEPPPGSSGWLVGISTEEGGTNLTATLRLRNAAVSTSGDIEQFVEIGGVRYSHIVDPRTGAGLTNRLGVTVIASDATTTDSLATAISVLGVKDGLEAIEARSDLAAVIVDLNGEPNIVHKSSRFDSYLGHPEPQRVEAPEMKYKGPRKSITERFTDPFSVSDWPKTPR